MAAKNPYPRFYNIKLKSIWLLGGRGTSSPMEPLREPEMVTDRLDPVERDLGLF